MRYWIGCVFLVPAFYLLWNVRQQLADALRTFGKTRQGADEADDLEPSSMAAFAQIARTVVMFMVAFLAVKVTAAYIILDGARYVSLFDLASTLFLLASYATWLRVKTTPRTVEQRSQAQRQMQPSAVRDHSLATESVPDALPNVRRSPETATPHHLDTNGISVAHLAARPQNARQTNSGLESKS
jgi:hypothetical protein